MGNIVWHETGERQKPKCLKKSVEERRKWGCFLQQELNLFYSYMAESLEEHAVPSLQASPNQPALFMPDNVLITLQNGKLSGRVDLELHDSG